MRHGDDERGSGASVLPVRQVDHHGDRLLAAVARTPADDPGRAAALAAAVDHWAPLALGAAAGYRRRTREPEDLRQVALLALVRAVLRYRPEVGPFPPYALPCVMGEVRHWLRDDRGLVRVPRRVVELDVRAVAAEEELVQRLTRTPSVAELADVLGVGHGALRRARSGRAARVPAPLPAVGSRADVLLAGAGPGDHRGVAGRVDDRVTVTRLLRGLDVRSRQVLVLRFWGDRTQQEIADVLGVSQVQVSRIIRRSLTRLRAAAG